MSPLVHLAAAAGLAYLAHVLALVGLIPRDWRGRRAIWTWAVLQVALVAGLWALQRGAVPREAGALIVLGHGLGTGLLLGGMRLRR